VTAFIYSAAGLKLTKSFEGCELTAYVDQGGVWSIGYGHTGMYVREGMTITQAEADALLSLDVAFAVKCVNKLVTANIRQNQFDALVDFVFNLGCSRLANSQLLLDVNAGKFFEAAAQFLRWDHVGKVVMPGLARRRRAEAAMFYKAVE